jgi:beta-galactosidase
MGNSKSISPLTTALNEPRDAQRSTRRSNHHLRLRGLLLAVHLAPFLLLAFALSGRASGAGANSITIDARTASQVPRPSSYHGGTLSSPSGHTIGINSMYLTMDKRPWLPVMGEFHYSRVPESEWEEELLKMKSAGVQIVSTYVIWIHHEEIEGEFDWSGRRDLRRFVELCGKHGLYVIVRIGPWTHGEVRNGGFPDWLLKIGPTRRNDPTYMASVATFYAELNAQLKGLLWKDDGPVIGIQLENEYAARGHLQGEEHILALKKLAIKNGLDVPLYTVTGWDNAVVPKGEVLPVFGGYPDAPWDASVTDLPPNEVYMFRFQSRVAGNMLNAGGPRASEANQSDTPYLTAELGGGVQDTYHRRPVIEPDDIAAMVPVMLGSGANMYGYYMFQGGQNPDGHLTPLQESQATGYPTDVPAKSYDFQAPLGQFGQERSSFRKLKVFHYFLNDFGSELAQMSVHAPARTPHNPGDFSVVRASVRSDGQQGFLFVNNYVRGAKTPIRSNTQFQILLPQSEVRIPEKPIDIPSGAYFIWPFNLKLGDSTLKYSTAQLFTRIPTHDVDTYFFEEIPGIPAEFVMKNDPGLAVHANGALVQRHGEDIRISRITTGLGRRIQILRRNGPEVRLILLSGRETEDAWKTNIDGSMHLLETGQDFFTDEKSFVLQSEGDARCDFSLFPALHGDLKLAGGNLDVHGVDETTHYTGSVPEERPKMKIEILRDAVNVPPVKLGPPLSWRPQGVAIAPDDSEFRLAANWVLSIPRNLRSSTISNIFLKIDYAGDVARLSADGNLLDDNFNNGMPWTIGLQRFIPKIGDGPLELSILPLRRDAPIFFERRFRASFDDKSQIVDLKSATLIPQYKFQMEMLAK